MNQCSYCRFGAARLAHYPFRHQYKVGRERQYFAYTGVLSGYYVFRVTL